MHVGDIEILPLSDGAARLPQQYFIGSDWSSHQALLGPDGTVESPIGCFVIRTAGQTVLVDAGLGPIGNEWLKGGELPGALAGAGVDPGDIDVVVCTHLHLDHVLHGTTGLASAGQIRQDALTVGRACTGSF